MKWNPNKRPFLTTFVLPFVIVLFTSCATDRMQSVLYRGTAKIPSDLGELTQNCEFGDPTSCFLKGDPIPLPTPRPFSMMQGYADDTSAVITALVPSDAVLHWYLFERKSGKVERIRVTRSYEKSFSRMTLNHFVFKELTPNQTYEIFAVDDEGMIVEHRSFQTVKTKSEKLKFALVSCSNDSYQHEQKEMWSGVIRNSPDVIFAVGDNVYADSVGGVPFGSQIDARTIWSRYVETREKLSVFKNPELIPFLATWDDHDFGMNDGDSTFSIPDPSREIMEAFFPIVESEPTVKPGPGVAKSVVAAGQTFLFFDNRSFRTPNQVPAICQSAKGLESPHCQNRVNGLSDEETHFGKIQEKWALNEIKNSTGPVWLISGDQWFGAYHPFESYEGNHPKSFESFMERLKEALVRGKKKSQQAGVIFLSGDRHLTEIMKVKPFKNSSLATYEITSSPIHAKTFPNSWKDFPNPRQMVGVSGVWNYAILETSLEKGTLQIKVTSHGKPGEKHFQRELAVKHSN